MRKIRIDLGIQIDLKKVPIYAESLKDRPSRYCAVGTIRYREVDGGSAEDGEILYLKPAICGGEPRDILHYQAQNKSFPHESTGDQWFSESQFESYRMLGAHAVGTICAAAGERIDDLAGLFRCAHRYVEDETEVVHKEAALVAVAPPPKPEHEPANAA